MTIRQEMLQAAARAPALLRDRRDRVVRFVEAQRGADGGFRDRGGRSDLFYTVFGIECLAALAADLPPEPVEAYLRGFGGGEGLDLVHLACLGRCWSACLPDRLGEDTRREILERIESCRSADGGYAGAGAGERGTAYGCFLALGGYQDLGAEVPDPGGLIGCLEPLRADDGAYANEPGRPVGSTPVTAAAVAILRHLGRPVAAATRHWLLSRSDESGGFVAVPGSPLPDLLSTATALHALAGMGAPLDQITGPSLRFVESLWDERGAFRGHWADEDLDCEYTYYGLLAMGQLSS